MPCRTVLTRPAFPHPQDGEGTLSTLAHALGQQPSRGDMDDCTMDPKIPKFSFSVFLPSRFILFSVPEIRPTAGILCQSPSQEQELDLQHGPWL